MCTAGRDSRPHFSRHSFGGIVRAQYSGILRLACSRYSQPYPQSDSSDVASRYDFYIATCLFCCFSCAVYKVFFRGLQLGIDIHSTSKCWLFNRPIGYIMAVCRRLGYQNKHTCQEETGITVLFEPDLSTKWKWYPHKRRHSRWKLSQQLKGK